MDIDFIFKIVVNPESFWQELLKVPEGQGILFSFQPLIAAIVVICAALIAYRGTTYAARQDAIKRAKYYNSVIGIISFNLKELNNEIDNIKDIQTFSTPIVVGNILASFDMECFDYDFIAPLSSKEIQYAAYIKLNVMTLLNAIERYKVAFEGFETAKKTENIVRCNEWFNNSISLIKGNNELIIKNIEESLKLTHKKFR